MGALSWNGHILKTGGLDGLLLNHDVCIHDSIVQTYIGHEQEVCGLKWSMFGQHVASGGNYSLLHVWDKKMYSSNLATVTPYLHRINEHCAAVKALSRYPFQSNILAFGGGIEIASLRFGILIQYPS